MADKDTSTVQAPPGAAVPPVIPPAGKASGGASTAEGAPAPAGPPKAKDLADLAREKARVAGRARAIQEQEAALKAKEAEYTTKIGDAEKKLADLTAKLEKWEKGNPLVTYAEQGKNPEDIVRDYAEKSAPERQIAALMQELKELRAKVEETPKLIAAKEAEFKAEGEKVREAHVAQLEANERSAFAKSLRAAGSKYRAVNAECDDDALESALSAIQAWVKTPEAKKARTKNGKFQPLGFDEVATYLDKQFTPVLESREERRKSLDGTQVPPGKEPPKKAPPGHARQSSADTSTKTKSSRREVIDPEEQAKDLQALRAAVSKDRTANGTPAKRP